VSVFRISLLASIALVLLALSPCLAESGVTDSEIVLGTSNALSGQSALAGKETNIGIDSYIKEVNSKGGVAGRKIRIVSADDKYEPEAAITCFNNLMQQGVFAISGMYGGACSAKYIPMAMNNKVPLVGFYNGSYFCTNPIKNYIFTTRCSYRDEMREAVDQLWKRGVRKFAMIYQNDAFGADCMEGMKAALKAHNTELVAVSSYTRNTIDVEQSVNDVKKADPEAVMLGAVYKPAAAIVKLAKKLNWSPIFVLCTGTDVYQFIKDAGDAANKNVVFTEAAPVPTSTDLPLLVTYQKALKRYYPQEKPNYASLLGYLDAVAFVEGLKRTGKDLTREHFVNAMESIHNDDVGLGKGMELRYSPTDHMGFHKVFFGSIKNGAVLSSKG